MGKQRLRMFAGPNGSGKSELIRELKEKDVPLGPVVNADKIAKKLQVAGFIDFSDYELNNITQDHWNDAITEIREIASRIKKIGESPEVLIRHNTLVFNSDKLSSYVSALIADFLRYMLVAKGVSFSFETVMSHRAKIEFLNFVKKKGYTSYLYFIATQSPEINVSRVQNRVAKGGHDVPEAKIRDRYYKSLDLLLDALRTVDRAFLIDNSRKSNFVILEKKYDGLGYPQQDIMPNWFMEYVMNKLKN